MANPNPRLENLKKFKPKWDSPTTAIRIPEKYKTDCMTLARGLESGAIPQDWQAQLDATPGQDDQDDAVCVDSFKTYKLRGVEVIRVADLVAAGVLDY